MIKMIKPITALAVLILCFGFAAPAFGQTKNTTPPKKDMAKDTAKDSKDAMPPGAESESGDEETQPVQAAVLWISSVEVIRSTHEPALDVIRVRAITSTEGWESGELVPMTKGAPEDGMLDLAFIAQAPTDASAPAKSPTIEAVFTLEEGHPFRGVRVYSATNRVLLKQIPGYVEAPNPPNDCTECLGKYFVAKGENPPSGVNADQVVREETLPKTVHVIKADDGIGKLDSDPNRLTLVLGESGKIIIAVWD
ncbi:MAG TPA: hypothetical protein VGD60_15155 [Candidatus Acidoferrales bacterium]